MIVLPELDRHQALSIVERIRAELAESQFGAHPQFTASFGVTDPQRHRNPLRTRPARPERSP